MYIHSYNEHIVHIGYIVNCSSIQFGLLHTVYCSFISFRLYSILQVLHRASEGTEISYLLYVEHI